jgi:hypothetical protein
VPGRGETQLRVRSQVPHNRRDRLVCHEAHPGIPTKKGCAALFATTPHMTVEDICNLRVGQLAAEDAHLWLWLTNTALHAGHHVMQAWGFTYRSCLTWIKPRFGLGHYLRNQTEHLLLGTRGKAPVLFRSQGTWLYAPTQEHSRKPEEQYAIIQRCSPGPTLNYSHDTNTQAGTCGETKSPATWHY